MYDNKKIENQIFYNTIYILYYNNIFSDNDFE